jgi:hypothetical protein
MYNDDFKDYEFQPISLVRDGVQVTYQKLLQQAYGGTFPEGGLDINSSCGIARTYDYKGDMHVNLTSAEMQQLDMDFINFDDDIAPLTYAKDPIPHESKAPFTFPDSENGAPGMFGKALRAYGEACAVMREYAQPTEEYTNWFCKAWDVNDEDRKIMKMCQPVVRSSGAAFWGGYGRNLKPLCLGYATAQSHIEFKSHAVKRTTFDDRALINWPKIQVLSRLIASQVFIDDRFTKHELKRPIGRIDFAILPFEIPKCPTKVRIVMVGEKAVPISSQSVMMLGTFNYIKRNIERQQAYSREKHGDFIRFECEDLIPETFPLQIAFPERGPTVFFSQIMGSIRDDFDIMNTERFARLPIPQAEKESITFRTAYLQLLESGAQAHKNSVMSVSEVKGYIADMDDQELKAKATAKLSKLILLLTGGKLLDALCNYGNLCGPKLGNTWMKQFLLSVGAPNNVYGCRAKRAIFAKCLTVDTVVKKISYDVMTALRALKSDVAPTYSRRLFSEIAGHADFVLGLEAIFIKRRNYWINRYKRHEVHLRREMNKEDDEGKKSNFKQSVVKYQFLVKAFKHAKFIVNPEGIACLDPTNLEITICEMATNYLEKRRKFNDEKAGIEVEHPDMNMDGIAKGELDVFVLSRSTKPPVMSFSKLPDLCKSQLEMFAKDITEFLVKIVSAQDIRDEEEHERILVEVGIEEGVKKITVQSIEDYVHVPFKMPQNPFAPQERVVPTREEMIPANMFGGFGLMGQVQEQLLDLYSELGEEYPGYKAEMLLGFCATKPSKIPAAQWEEYRKEYSTYCLHEYNRRHKAGDPEATIDIL